MKPSHSQAVLLAFGLLTWLPVRARADNSLTSQGLAVAYYPLVGVTLGLLLWAGSGLVDAAPASVSAVILLVLWVGLTGALHLDGLADCADGYFAGHRCADDTERRQRTLAVMREPTSGAMAVVALVLVLLAKWVLLAQLLEAQLLTFGVWLVLLTLPRAALLPYILFTRYARDEGLAQSLKNQLPTMPVLIAVLLTLALGIGVLTLPLAILSLVAVAVLTFLWRALWQKSIGGFTGDCLGALVELAELMLLLVITLALVSGP
ncbi:adenosylcobinamide-GDP ribazoletransferase [Marinimicrobium sp. ABcell2]|uniref:adenosylcobinamide-GDP ribazoletransferase n=1 Tax=Marinimicrobium sp. ABcell2 TaxID=3069751 RepID=UPI0027B10D10|nr:adenosylcobinamide-GDP ribazoletransferase [Marinimicrobium sp. ABcell2]MDQ2076736.1 adenosylcobinamide-GDP ribazoletransferase [Marinimicrobium sp. ABcell2]